MREQAERQGLVMLTSTPEGLRERIRAESAMWGKVIRDAGITPE
jgi:tripartite-type tricarboxylate transporter receptor subunit TctC